MVKPQIREFVLRFRKPISTKVKCTMQSTFSFKKKSEYIIKGTVKCECGVISPGRNIFYPGDNPLYAAAGLLRFGGESHTLHSYSGDCQNTFSFPENGNAKCKASPPFYLHGIFDFSNWGLPKTSFHSKCNGTPFSPPFSPHSSVPETT